MRKYKVTYLIYFVILILLCSCSKDISDDVIQTAIAKTSEAVTPTNTTVPTNTMAPTNTSEPTSTPSPTRTPLPTNTAQNQPGSRSNPFSLGEPGTFTLDGDKIITIAVVEVLFGDDAYNKVIDANMFNDEPPEGLEYIIVKLSINYLQGSSPDDLLEISYSVWGGDIEIGCVSNNKIVTENSWVSGLEPELDFKLFPESQAEGYHAIFCEIGDQNPLLYLEIDDGGNQYFSLN